MFDRQISPCGGKHDGAGYVRERPLWQLGRPDIDVEGTEQADFFAFDDPPNAYIATAQQRLSEYGEGMKTDRKRTKENCWDSVRIELLVISLPSFPALLGSEI